MACESLKEKVILGTQNLNMYFHSLYAWDFSELTHLLLTS